jgi:hypothetical protein
MTAEEAAAYAEVERTEEARQAAAQRRGRQVSQLAWSHDNDRLARIVEPDGNEYLRLQFTLADEDKHGHAIFRTVTCLVRATFTVLGNA